MGHMTLPGQSSPKPARESGRFELFWPQITDLESATSAARQGGYVALIFGAATGLFAGLAMMNPSSVLSEMIDGWAFVDAGIFFCVALGIFLNSRVAAVVGLILYVAERIFMMASEGPKGIFVTILFTMAFVTSVRGTFAVHQFWRVQPMSGARITSPAAARLYAGVTRVSLWTAVAIALATGAYLYYT